MRAKGIAQQKNEQAALENSPFRWHAVSSGNSAQLVKYLYGKKISSAVSPSKKERVLQYIKEIEATHGRSENLSLVDIRELSETGFWLNSPVEAWVFDNEGVRVIYSVVLDDQNFKLNGPWIDDTRHKKVIPK